MSLLIFLIRRNGGEAFCECLMDARHMLAGAGAEPSAEEAEAAAAEADAALTEYASHSGVAGIVGDIGQVGSPSYHPSSPSASRIGSPLSALRRRPLIF